MSRKLQCPLPAAAAAAAPSAAGSRRCIMQREQEICRRRGWFPQLIFAYFLASLPSLPKSVGRYESEREREDPREAFTYR